MTAPADTDTTLDGQDPLSAASPAPPRIMLPQKTNAQTVTLAGRGVASASRFGLRLLGPALLNRAGGPTNWTGIGNNVEGGVTPLGRVGGGLGALGGGFGMYSSGAGFANSWDQGNKTGMFLNGGTFVANAAYTVGGVAEVMGNASLAADSTGVGVCIGVPLQVVGLGFQIHDIRQQSNYMTGLMNERLTDEAAQSNGGYAAVTGYVPGLPLKPEFSDYQGLSSLRTELNVQKTTFAEGNRINLDDLARDPQTLDRVAGFAGGQYDTGVQNRKTALDDMGSWLHTSTFGHFEDFLRRNVRGIDDAAIDQKILATGEQQIALGTAGRAAQQELQAGAPSAQDPGKLVGYDWRLDDYNRRLAPLEGAYPGQAAELNKLRDIHVGIQQDAHNPAQLDRFVNEQARQNVLAERQKIEALDPAAQEAYFNKNKEFIEKAGIDKSRPDLALVGLSTSREEYNAKALQFAPAVFADKAQAAIDQNATTLAMVNSQGAVYTQRAKDLARILPDVKPEDLPVVDKDGKPALKDGNPFTFTDAQDALAASLKDARAQLDTLKKDPQAAAGDADAKARVALQTVAVQSLQMQYANNENQNLAFRLQAYDQRAAALGQENAALYQDMARQGLDKVPVTPDAAMLQADQSLTGSRQAIAQDSQALADARKAFDKTFGAPEAQAVLLKKGDAAYVAGLEKLQAVEFGIGVEEIKALKAENVYLKEYQGLAQKEIAPPTAGASHFVSTPAEANNGAPAGPATPDQKSVSAIPAQKKLPLAGPQS